jgi:hypothetical protein
MPLLEDLAARFAHQFPTMPLNLETDAIPWSSRPAGRLASAGARGINVIQRIACARTVDYRRPGA